MPKRILALAVLAVVLAACGSAATPPSGTQPPGTEAPTESATDGGGVTAPPNAGDLEATARALVPPGATETGHLETGGVFQLYLTSAMSLADLEAFFDQKIPSLGITVSGKFTVSGTLTYAFTNPEGGIVAGEDTSGAGGTSIIISVGSAS